MSRPSSGAMRGKLSRPGHRIEYDAPSWVSGNSFAWGDMTPAQKREFVAQAGGNVEAYDEVVKERNRG